MHNNDESWVENIQNILDEYDSKFRQNKMNKLEESTPESERILVESAWVCPYDLPVPPEPPD